MSPETTSDNLVIEPIPDTGSDKYEEYKEIDLFRRILANLLQVPKSGTATALVDRFRTFIADDAKILKKAHLFDRVEATMSAAALLKHVCECEDCKHQLPVCATLEDMKYISVDVSSEQPVLPVTLAGARLGRYTTEVTLIPNQRNSHNN